MLDKAVRFFSGQFRANPSTVHLCRCKLQQCSGGFSGFHWMFDTYSSASGAAAALTKGGDKSWYFITVDYAFGHSLEKDTSEMVTSNGGSVLGSVRHPLNASDFSSFILQAQNSKPLAQSTCPLVKQ